ncbi:Oidioi.mRNA.OKI2018_I69.XSR.g14048.t1.cds [Oikopleura dioica]|uniref:Oidioi.mRNA.OKI2018_I69.XSR.g14048.t1.cds n=1 Tax=Oikopleura dioica TaxID=34765 RepID=A0ABN7SCP6_OIKDI|nr:Oidioi.mRNA.OKI2018_I69.XSR.g14048.t1.cds [Oikopleura dioica]
MSLDSKNLDNYQRIEKVGEGTYGVVYKSKYKLTDQLVALKKIRLEGEEDGVPATSIREICTLKELQHPNIVKLIDVILDTTKVYLVFEYLYMDLKRYIDEQKTEKTRMDMGLTTSYAYQVCQAMDFCHSRRIIHRDMKPQNLLIDRGGLIKIADFGLARAYKIPFRPLTHEVITMWYRAPEIMLGKAIYSCPVDCWSVGAIIAEMLTNVAIFAGDSEIDQLFKIFRVLGTPTEDTWPGVSQLSENNLEFNLNFPIFPRGEWPNPQRFKIPAAAVDLVHKFLDFDPAKRLTAKEALDHPFFDRLNKTLFPGNKVPAVPYYDEEASKAAAILNLPLPEWKENQAA